MNFQNAWKNMIYRSFFHVKGLTSPVCRIRGGSKTAATSKIERFVIIVNGFQPLTIITKCSILDVAVVALDPPLRIVKKISLEYIDK